MGYASDAYGDVRVTTYFAEELTAPEFAAFVDAETIGVLPLAGIGPHGPHLPLSTDCDIARALLAHLGEVVPEDIHVLVLPLQTAGSGLRQAGLPGAFGHAPDTLLAVWGDIVRTFHRAGGRKLIVVSSQEANADIAAVLAGLLRADLNMLAVVAGWRSFGVPEGVVDAREAAYGGDGGAVQTALMQHYWPEAVRADKLRSFHSAAEDWDFHTSELKAHGAIRPAWTLRDLNRDGATGDASVASPESGAAIARHQLHGFGELVADVAAFDLQQLRHRT